MTLLFALAACGSHGPHDPSGTMDGAEVDPDATHAPGDGAQTVHDAAIDAPRPDAFPAVLDVRIDCHNDCTLHAVPSMIAVQSGTSFQVNWINTGDTVCDVAKIDQFNQVPIIIGLEPGTSYHDAVRDWCGTLFTGTFDFRISICTLPSYIPVNCGL